MGKANFNMIVMVTKNYSIKYEDSVPWENEVYLDYFNSMTKDGALIMGRKTYETLPLNNRPFQNKLNLVMSKEYPKYSQLTREKLKFINPWLLDNMIIPGTGTGTGTGTETGTEEEQTYWVIGGREMYELFWERCENVHMCVLEKNVKGSVLNFIDLPPCYELIEHSEKKFSSLDDCYYRFLHYKKNDDSPCIHHERQYLGQLNTILKSGNARDDRTGVGTIGLFGVQHRYDVSKYLPLLTTKFVPIGVIIKELLWFMRGETDSKILENQGVNIWKGNTSREFLDKRGLSHLPEGDIGKGYGFQWRHFGAEYVDGQADYTGQGFDQLGYIIDLLKNDPFNRRILLSAWCPTDLDKMALPPCHVLVQFYVEEDQEIKERYLSCQLYQRSSDFFLAGNYNLVSYTILLYILAKKTGYKPKEMIHTFGDIHCYKNHIEQVKLQLGRQPRMQPILELDDSIKDKPIEEITVDDFTLIGYFPHPTIKAEMAV